MTWNMNQIQKITNNNYTLWWVSIIQYLIYRICLLIRFILLWNIHQYIRLYTILIDNLIRFNIHTYVQMHEVYNIHTCSFLTIKNKWYIYNRYILSMNFLFMYINSWCRNTLDRINVLKWRYKTSHSCMLLWILNYIITKLMNQEK